LPRTAPPSIRQVESDHEQQLAENMRAFFKKAGSQSKSDSDKAVTPEGTPVQVRKFFDSIGSPKFLRRNQEEFRKDFEKHMKKK
jgi:hypothetical protein